MQASKSRNGTSSPNKNKNPKNRGIRTTDRASPRSPLPEKKHTNKVSELESPLAQFQEELKKANDQLISLESQKKRAQQEAEESKKQVSSLSAKLEDLKQQLIELSDSDDARLQELRKLSQERDRSWQTELEALQKQHAADTAALSSSMNEVQRLKKQLEITSESEATQSRHAESAHEEIQSLRIELSETIEMIETMKHQLTDAKVSEAHAFEVMSEAQIQLEAIRSVSLEAKEAYDSLASELEKSKAEISTLEKLVSQLQGNAKSITDYSAEEIESLKLEAGRLKSALEASEARYQNEYIQSTLQIRVAYEAVERVKVESNLKETALVEELKKAKEAIQELKSDLSSKTEASEDESDLIMEMKKLEEELTDMKSALLDKETQLQTLIEENDILRTEVTEKEVVMKLGSLSDEVNEKGRRTTKFGELLDTTQMEKAELEAELRRLKVQADQWRKAAEAAAAILSPDCDPNMIERTVSVDMLGMKLDSPFLDSMDDDSLKKKNANMLKKIGGLWKKGQK